MERSGPSHCGWVKHSNRSISIVLLLATQIVLPFRSRRMAGISIAAATLEGLFASSPPQSSLILLGGMGDIVLKLVCE